MGGVNSAFGLLWWYEVGLRRAVRDYQVNAVFSMTNYLPLRRLNCPTVLLEQHAGHFSSGFCRSRIPAPKSSPALGWRLKNMWVRRSVTACLIPDCADLSACRCDCASKPAVRGRTFELSRMDLEIWRYADHLARVPLGSRTAPRWLHHQVGRTKELWCPLSRNIKSFKLGRSIRLVLTLDPALPMNLQFDGRGARARNSGCDREPWRAWAKGS